MKEARRFSALLSMPNNSKMFVFGGETNSRTRLKSVEQLIGGHWTRTEKDLIEKVSRHCAVQISDDVIYIIGGHLGEDQFSDRIMTFNINTHSSFIINSKLSRGRQSHSCSMFETNKVIVAGGRDARGLLKSVEILNMQTSKWTDRKDLELPIAINHAQMVPHPLGKYYIRRGLM
jgi:hypothetical protein